MNIKFKTSTDFRKSLEARLQVLSAKTKEDLQRLRRKVAFDRFLARIFVKEQSGFYLKGGYAMELRIAHARATKDIDLTCMHRVHSPDELLNEFILSDLQTIAKIDLNDHFVYEIRRSHIDLENAPYGGARFSVSTLIDSKLFVRFQLDVGADFLLDQVEVIKGTNWLEFCGISAPAISMISIEQQFAEKLHSYTLPRGEKGNSRVKDLIDMVLLLNMKTPNSNEMIRTIQKVFKKRNTHPFPLKLPTPPIEWETRFIEMAIECGLSQDMQMCFRKISDFYDQKFLL